MECNHRKNYRTTPVYFVFDGKNATAVMEWCSAVRNEINPDESIEGMIISLKDDGVLYFDKSPAEAGAYIVLVRNDRRNENQLERRHECFVERSRLSTPFYWSFMTYSVTDFLRRFEDVK